MLLDLEQQIRANYQLMVNSDVVSFVLRVGVGYRSQYHVKVTVTNPKDFLTREVVVKKIPHNEIIEAKCFLLLDDSGIPIDTTNPDLLERMAKFERMVVIQDRLRYKAKCARLIRYCSGYVHIRDVVENLYMKIVEDGWLNNNPS